MHMIMFSGKKEGENRPGWFVWPSSKVFCFFFFALLITVLQQKNPPSAQETDDWEITWKCFVAHITWKR